MKDYELEILGQYDIEVNSTRKGRGVYLMDTVSGPLLLKQTTASERKMELLAALGKHLADNGYPNTDVPVKNREEMYVSTAADGSRYIVKKWFAGRECNIQKDYEMTEAAKNLAYIHNILQIPVESGGEEEWTKGASLEEEYRHHNQELKKIRAFIRRRTKKGEFERTFLKYFEPMYEMAQAVTERTGEEAYKELQAKSIRRKTLVHGDYNYHNVLMLPAGMATVHFDACRMDIQCTDVYYFLRKLLEKHRWDRHLGEQLLRSYSLIHPIGQAEMDYLALRLSYPEKFFKAANTYYQSNKARISEKSVEKLLTAVRETELKRRFLEDIFSFHL